MNQMIQWPPAWERCTCHQQPCTCGCEDDGDFRCTPEWKEGLLKCWSEIARFKKMLEQMIIELNMSGPAGPQGSPGVQGPVGPAGAAGPAGLDLAYVGPTAPASPQQGELWMDTQNQYLMVYETGTGFVNVTGAIPVPGPQGPVGPQGSQGPVGPQGVQGVQGPVGPSGAQGVQGPQGSAGPQGQPAFVNGGIGTVAMTVDNGNAPGPGWNGLGAFSAQGSVVGNTVTLYLWQRIA